MQEKESQIADLSESMKKSYWNETNLRTYQKLLKLQKETGDSLQSLSLAYFFHQPDSAGNRCQQSDTAERCSCCLRY